MKNELLGKDEISISVGGVDFTASKIAEMIRSHTRQNNEAAEILRDQMIELDRVKALLDEAVPLLETARKGMYFEGSEVYEKRIEDLLQKLKGGE